MQDIIHALSQVNTFSYTSRFDISWFPFSSFDLGELSEDEVREQLLDAFEHCKKKSEVPYSVSANIVYDIINI